MRAPHRSSAALSALAALGALLLGATPAEAAGGALGKLKLARSPTPLLGGRLQIGMPAKARLEARRASVMAAEEAVAEETRVVLDAGAERLVLMVWEDFTFADTDLDKAVPSVFAKWTGTRVEDATYERVKLGRRSPLVAIAVTPKKPDPTAEAVLVHAVYVRSADTTVQLLAFFVNPEGAKDLKGSVALARRAAATLAPGAKTLDRAAGARRLAVAGGPALVLDAPEGAVAITQPGPDFDVFRLRFLAPFGKPGAGRSIGIYVGGHPSLQATQQGLDPKAVKRTKGTLLGAKVEWQTWSRDGSTTSEVIAPLPGGSRLAVHVFCTAADAAQVEKLRAAAETLRVAK